mmetsp:Transcript_37995/g.53546  ORF Transcript_37995/g.53546 Transcript_37995/m.53546 type:complete len:200 (-) Transcript_37995:123-722(-)
MQRMVQELQKTSQMASTLALSSLQVWPYVTLPNFQEWAAALPTTVPSSFSSVTPSENETELFTSLPVLSISILLKPPTPTDDHPEEEEEPFLLDDNPHQEDVRLEWASYAQKMAPQWRTSHALVGQSLAKALVHGILARIVSQYELILEEEGSMELALTLKPVGVRVKAILPKGPKEEALSQHTPSSPRSILESSILDG